MEKRAARVSEAQWQILLEFLERYPNLARARGYNNSARGRAESACLWQEVADALIGEGTGTTKTPKDWSVYVSNYKSKLKKIVADINANINATGGGPPQGSTLSEQENRFLSIKVPGFGHTAPGVSVNPFPEVDPQEPSTSVSNEELVGQSSQQTVLQPGITQTLDVHPKDVVQENVHQPIPGAEVEHNLPGVEPLPLPRRPRRTRYRSRPLAPLEEARRILSQVEMQRAAADDASARALNMIGQNLGRLTDAMVNVERQSGTQAETMVNFVHNFGRLVDIFDRFVEHNISHLN